MSAASLFSLSIRSASIASNLSCSALAAASASNLASLLRLPSTLPVSPADSSFVLIGRIGSPTSSSPASDAAIVSAEGPVIIGIPASSSAALSNRARVSSISLVSARLAALLALALSILVGA